MNGVKGKFMKRLKSIKPIGYLKQDRILQALSPDGLTDYFSRNENLEVHCKKIELMRNPDVSDEATEFDYENDNKENIKPRNKSNGLVEYRNEPEFRRSECLIALSCSDSGPENRSAETQLTEIDISSFRPPDMNSGSLFDPNLLAVFREAVMEHLKMREAEIKCRIHDENNEEEEEEEENPLFGFRENCPPGGSESVILYTTTLRGIRKTFEDCNRIRFLLETFRVKFQERDISMHSEFKEELWSVLESKGFPPKLFIKGRYIGGAEEVVGLHEQGKLRRLFASVPIDHFAGSRCDGCGGIRFVLCFNCNGSRKVILENEERIKCPECNENGLILCPYCC